MVNVGTTRNKYLYNKSDNKEKTFNQVREKINELSSCTMLRVHKKANIAFIDLSLKCLRCWENNEQFKTCRFM